MTASPRALDCARVGDVEQQQEETAGGANLPVVAEARPIERPAPAPLEPRALAVMAAGGAVAGAATVATVRVLNTARKRRKRRRARKGRELGSVVGTRSFLIDVHLLDRS